MVPVHYEPVLGNERLRRLLTWRAAVIPVTAAAIPAGFLVAAVLSVATRQPSVFLAALPVAVVTAWLIGFFLFTRQQGRYLTDLSRRTYTYDGHVLACAEEEGGISIVTVSQLAAQLNQGGLDPAELPPPGFIPRNHLQKAGQFDGLKVFLHGYNAFRDRLMTGNFAADGTPVWDLRTHLVRDVEELAWKIGSVTDPGWHTRPR